MKKKTIFLILLILLILIQLIRVDQTNPESKNESNYFVVASVPTQVQSIMQESCYDCHSNQTVYPWYSKVAPASWFMNNHIKEARGKINFSEWDKYTAEDQVKILEECIEVIEENEMPLKSYILIHPQAKLSDEEKDALLKWFMPGNLSGEVPVLN